MIYSVILHKNKPNRSKVQAVKGQGHQYSLLTTQSAQTWNAVWVQKATPT